jgi:hypothetical protein
MQVSIVSLTAGETAVTAAPTWTVRDLRNCAIAEKARATGYLRCGNDFYVDVFVKEKHSLGQDTEEEVMAKLRSAGMSTNDITHLPRPKDLAVLDATGQLLNKEQYPNGPPPSSFPVIMRFTFDLPMKDSPGTKPNSEEQSAVHGLLSAPTKHHVMFGNKVLPPSSKLSDCGVVDGCRLSLLISDVKPECWVDSWVLKDEIGLGYRLSNGCKGVLFNDGIGMVKSSDKHVLAYSVKAVKPLTVNLQQKMKLFRQFQKELLLGSSPKGTFRPSRLATHSVTGCSPVGCSPVPTTHGLVNYAYTATGILLYFGELTNFDSKKPTMRSTSSANELVCHCFFDDLGEVVLSHGSVVHVDPNGEVCAYPVDNTEGVECPCLRPKLMELKQKLTSIHHIRIYHDAGKEHH